MEGIQESRKRPMYQDVEPGLIRIPLNETHTHLEQAEFIRINQKSFKIGRAATSNACILDTFISRTHCTLDYDCVSHIWRITNLSKFETFVNGYRLQTNERRELREGDIVQLSASKYFRYKFTLALNADEMIKQPRLDASSVELNAIRSRQADMNRAHLDARENLEKQLSEKQQEQVKLQEELKMLLEDQQATKSSNEELNNQIIELRNKIESGNKLELELQDKYKELFERYEEEKQKFENLLKEEKDRFNAEMEAERSKWQEELNQRKLAQDEQEMKMSAEMEELRTRQKEDWEKKVEAMMKEQEEAEKFIQDKFADEKRRLEDKLKEMESALQEKNARTAELEQKQKEIESRRRPAHCHIIQGTIDLTKEDYMDTAPPLDPNGIAERAEETFTCSICSEYLITPMNLNCSHTYCLHCIGSWVKRSNGKPTCPECRAPIVSASKSLAIQNFVDSITSKWPAEQLAKRKQMIEARKNEAKNIQLLNNLSRKQSKIKVIQAPIPNNLQLQQQQQRPAQVIHVLPSNGGQMFHLQTVAAQQLARIQPVPPQQIRPQAPVNPQQTHTRVPATNARIVQRAHRR